MSVTTRITLKHVKTVLKDAFMRKSLDGVPPKLGRWSLSTTANCNETPVDLKIMHSNEDHCGTCAEYLLIKRGELNKPQRREFTSSASGRSNGDDDANDINYDEDDFIPELIPLCNDHHTGKPEVFEMPMTNKKNPLFVGKTTLYPHSLSSKNGREPVRTTVPWPLADEFCMKRANHSSGHQAPVFANDY